MKLVFYLMVFTAIEVSASEAIAQKINYSGQHVAVKDILSVIEKQSGYLFFYDVTLVNEAKAVSVNFEDITVNEAMDQICASQNFSWVAEKKTISLVARQTAESPGNNVPDLQKELLQIIISGQVTDKDGKPLTGATIVLKGTTSGVNSDGEGRFTIKARENDILLVSYIGFKPREIRITDKTTYNILLETDIQAMDEVQVIGYGTTTKRLSTSSLGSVKADVMERQPVTNVFQAMQGRIAGVSITQADGAIGSNVGIQIRGVNTIQSGSQPLIIVDGAVIPNTTMVTSSSDSRSSASGVGGYMIFGATSLNTVNPSDIESIEILKDADATSIYGSRGTNGVVLITTKKAKLGVTKFNLETSTGVNSATYLAPYLTTDRYLQMRKDAFAAGNYNPTTKVAINPIATTAANAPDLVTWDQNANTDWGKFEFDNPAPTFNLQANLSGGDKKLNFYSSAGYSKQSDITRGNPYQERFSGYISLNHTSLNDKFRIFLNTNFSIDNLSPSKGNVSGSGGLIQSLPSNMPQTNPDGTPYWPSGTILQNTLLTNPYAADDVEQNSETNNFLANLDVSYKITKNISIKTQFGYNNQLNNTASTLPSTAINPLIASSTLPNRKESQTAFSSINIEPQINYSGTFSKGHLDVMVGSTFFDRTTKTFGLEFEGYTSDLLLDSWAAATTVTRKSNTMFSYRFNSLFGRVGYNWDSKYLLNITYRRDGSSRFGPDNKWANFGALGMGWIFTREEFIKHKIPFLSFGKLRGSYGSTGNDNIADFRYTSLFTATGILYNGDTGLAPAYLANSTFSWETSKKLDVALELGFLKERVLLNVDWFRTRTTDLLIDMPVPSQTGFTSYLSNMPGLLQNQGWEFDLTTNNLNPNNKVQWKTTFNLNLLDNKLLEYPNLAASPYVNKLEIGKPVLNPGYPTQLERAFVYQGVDKDTGLPKFEDVNGDGVFTASGFTDTRFVGSTIPRTFGGLGNVVTYKGFSLDLFFQFSQQLTSNYLFNGTYPGQLSNTLPDFSENYWKQPGDNTTYPRLYPGTGANTSTTLLTSAFPYSSAASADLMFIRLKNVSISYSLPNALVSRAKMNSVTFFIRGQNLMTWTSKEIYKDPEAVFGRMGSMLKTWSAGFQISL